MKAEAARAVLCVDIGGTSSKAGVLTADRQLSLVDSIPTRPPQDEFFARLRALIEGTRTAAQSSFSIPLRSMGVAVAGFLDEGRGRLLYNPNLAWLEGLPLRESLWRAFPDTQIELEVDSNAATSTNSVRAAGAAVFCA